MEFKYITNPDTNRKCLLKSPTGRRVLKNYLNYQSGGRVTKLQRVTGQEGVQANASALHSSTGSACSPLEEDDCRKHPACSWGKHGKSSVMSCGRKAQGEGLAKARAVRAANVAARKGESATSSRAASPVAPKPRKLERVTGQKGLQANANPLHSSTGSACSPLEEDDCGKHPACSWGKHGRSSVMSCGRKAQGEGLAKARAVRAANVAARKAESATSSRAASPVAPKPRGRKPKSATYESVAAEMRAMDLSPLPSVRGGPRQLGKRLQALGEDAELDCIHYPNRGTEHKKSCASQSPRCKWVKGTGCVPGEWEAGQPIPGVKKRAVKGGRRNNW